jgi:hypothetical protein
MYWQASQGEKSCLEREGVALHRWGWVGILASLACALGSVSWGYSFAGGTGEPNDPYQVATAAQLISIGSDPNLLSKHFVLVADIDLDPNLPGGRVFDRVVIARGAPEMKQKSSFEGWDFNEVWTIREGQDSPKLKWEK